MNKALMRALPVFALALLAALPAQPALAASLTLTVKQGSGAAQTVTCGLLQKNCTLPFVLNAGQPAQQSVNINVLPGTNSVLLSFQTTGGYYYARNMNSNIVSYFTLLNGAVQGKPAAYNIGLFQPLSPQLVTIPAGNTSRAFVASLTITATPNP